MSHHASLSGSLQQYETRSGGVIETDRACAAVLKDRQALNSAACVVWVQTPDCLAICSASCRYLILAMVKLIGLSRLGKLQRAAAVMTFFFNVVVCFDR